MSGTSDDDLQEEPPESPKSEVEKWWHVPDERIEELVSVQHEPSGQGDLTSALADATLKGTRRRSAAGRVRFHGHEEEDSLDRMLRRTQERLAQSAGQQPFAADGEKSWKVSDSQIEQLVLSMSTASLPSATSQATISLGKSSKLGLAGTASLGKSASSSRCAANDRIEVWIYFVSSEDAMRLRVPLDLPLGPPDKPKSNRFTDMYGLGASTKGFALAKHTFDQRHRKFVPANSEEWVPEWSNSLKGMIEQYAEIEMQRIRLFHRQYPMSHDTMTLRSYGIKNGDTISLRIQRWVPGMASRGRDVQLASSKRLDTEEKSEATKYDGWSLRLVKRLNEFRKADGDVYMQPKWLSEKNPRLFAKVGIKVDGSGNYTVKKDPADFPIWLQDRDDDRLRRVRVSVGGRQ